MEEYIMSGIGGGVHQVLWYFHLEFSDGHTPVNTDTLHLEDPHYSDHGTNHAVSTHLSTPT